MENKNDKYIGQHGLIDEEPEKLLAESYPDDDTRDNEITNETTADADAEVEADVRAEHGVHGLSWLVGVAAVIVIALIAGWIVTHSENKATDPTSAYAVNTTVKTDVQKAPATGATAAAQTASATTTATAASGTATASDSAPDTKGAASTAVSDQDRIEEEAREVIHGDFGDNPGRKAKLGADYAAVQARVNQILHSHS